jgi:hypothetical protein
MPENFLHLAVDPTNNHIQVLRYRLEKFTVNIWEYLNKIPVIECNTVKQLQVVAIDILKSSKRGCGNILVCSEEFKDAMDLSVIVDANQDTKWSENFKIYESCFSIPNNEAILLYKGQESDIDGGLFMYETPDKKLIIYKEVPEFKNYIRRLKITV